MRSFLFDKEKSLKILYRILSVFLSICWAIIAFMIGFAFFTYKYVYPLEYKKEIIYYADAYDLDRALIFAVVKTESSFNKDAVSSKGATGLMQITKRTGKYVASELGVKSYDLTNVSDNLNLGCYYLSRLKKRFIDEYTALSAYNAGEGNVSAWLKNPKYSQDGVTLKDIPFNETKEYIIKIKQNFSKYKKLYGNILDKR